MTIIEEFKINGSLYRILSKVSDQDGYALYWVLVNPQDDKTESGLPESATEFKTLSEAYRAILMDLSEVASG